MRSWVPAQALVLFTGHVFGPLQDWNVFQKLPAKFSFCDPTSDAVRADLRGADNGAMSLSKLTQKVLLTLSATYRSNIQLRPTASLQSQPHQLHKTNLQTLTGVQLNSNYTAATEHHDMTHSLWNLHGHTLLMSKLKKPHAGKRGAWRGHGRHWAC